MIFTSICIVYDETPQRTYNRYRREAIAFKQIYPQEHFNFWDFVRLLSTNLLSDYFHAWHDGVLTQNLLPIFAFRLMQFWGTYQGFVQQGAIGTQLKQTFYYPRTLSRPANFATLNSKRKVIDYTTQEKSLEQVH